VKSTLAYLDGNDGKALLALGEQQRFVLPEHSNNLDRVQEFIDSNSGAYIFTGLSYDLKQAIHGLHPENEDYSHLPLAFLWIPEVVLEIKNGNINKVLQGTPTPEIELRVQTFLNARDNPFTWRANMKPRTSKAEYLKTVLELQDAIQYGNIYEVNYCQEFYDDAFEMEDPPAAFFRLNNLTQAPFSAYLAFDEFHILCGSPERFLQKKGEVLLSQPIKGTRKRSSDHATDELLKEELRNDPKERAENVMIVDLVRNDLSRLAQKSSVSVDELFGVYTFKTVHQLISTVSCSLKPQTSFVDILKATFPMGSMTGAPKRSAMQLIEKHENFRRGWYSGAIGYIDPNGDFDLNVVIRSLIYNQNKKHLSCAVGGAITIQSTPEGEYEECKVKVKTILDQMQNA